MNQLKLIRNLRPYNVLKSSMAHYGDEIGSGAGRGGGAGGTIREAGGAFGQRGAATEEKYFRKLQADQLQDLKGHMSDEISFHQEQIKRHQEAIEKAKEKLATLSEN